MKRALLVVTFLFLGHSAAFAQLTGNCPAGNANPSVRSGTPIRIAWCQGPAQPSGAPEQLVAAAVTGLGTAKVALTGLTKLAGPYADGKVQWTATIPAQPRGNYTIVLTTSNYAIAGDPSTIQEGAGSAPFVFAVVDGTTAPTASTNIRVGP